MGVLIRSLFFASGACVALVVFPGVAAAQQRVLADGVVERPRCLKAHSVTFGSDLPWTEWAARSPIGIAPFALSRIMWRQR